MRHGEGQTAEYRCISCRGSVMIQGIPYSHTPRVASRDHITVVQNGPSCSKLLFSLIASSALKSSFPR
jgi:hypothetical protein